MNVRQIEALAEADPELVSERDWSATGRQDWGVTGDLGQIPTFKQRAAGLAGAAHEIAVAAASGNVDATESGGPQPRRRLQGRATTVP